MYNYYAAVLEDVKTYIEDEINFADFESIEDLEEHLNDVLWTCDSVTGNASGSYYCNSWKAEEALSHNWDLLAEALENFGCEVNVLEKGAEYCDVTIRCYLLSGSIAGALEDLEEEFEKAHEEQED